MTNKEILSVLEQQIAPVALSDQFCKRYGAYDNSGLIIDLDNPVKGVLFSLDLSEEAVRIAAEKGYNLIVTHHPAIYGGISRMDVSANSKSRALVGAIKSGISVISMHLNFDSAPEGIDYFLMKGLGGQNAKIALPLEGGGYGRVYDVQPVSVGEYIANIKSEFSTRRIICHGEENRTIRCVASFCGAGCDDVAVSFAKAERADAFVSSDLKHHEIAELVESGITVIQLTHYCAESYGFGRIYEKVKRSIGLPSYFFADVRFN